MNSAAGTESARRPVIALRHTIFCNHNGKLLLDSKMSHGSSTRVHAAGRRSVAFVRGRKFVRSQEAKRAVRADLVVVKQPKLRFAPCIGERQKRVFIEEFVANASVEAFDV